MKRKLMRVIRATGGLLFGFIVGVFLGAALPLTAAYGCAQKCWSWEAWPWGTM